MAHQPALLKPEQRLIMAKVALEVEETDRQLLEPEPLQRAGDGCFDGDGCSRGIQVVVQVHHLADHHHLIGNAQLCEDAAEDHFAFAIGGGGINAGDTSLKGAGHQGARVGIGRLAGPIGDAIGRQAQLGGAQHEP